MYSMKTREQIKRFSFLTVLQSKEELLILQELLYGVQANVYGIHVNQRLQNIGAQPSSATRCLSVV